MENGSNRREFSRALGLGLGAALLTSQQAPAAPARRLKIGHTGITWGFRPEDAEQAIKDVGSLGYHGFESFGNVLEAWEPKTGLGRVLQAANLPLVSAYCGVNLIDPTRRAAEVERIVRWGTLIQKYGGTVAVIGPNAVKRPSYDFAKSKADIVAALNDMCKALADIGIVGAMHQHTGTCVEFRDEVYAVMEAVDTRYVKFGPDVGQLVKGGSNAVQVVSDFLPSIRHVHFKDFIGGAAWEGYCPLGEGKVGVDAAKILGMLETVKDLEYVMVELDPSPNPPQTPIDTARESKKFLQGLGYTFRS
jgi:inosose dehydratase